MVPPTRAAGCVNNVQRPVASATPRVASVDARIEASTTSMNKNDDRKPAAGVPEKLKRRKHQAELATLQAEVVALQEWVKTLPDGLILAQPRPAGPRGRCRDEVVYTSTGLIGP